MPWLRRTDRLHRAAREGRSVEDSGPPARGRGHQGNSGHEGNRGRGDGSAVSALTDRIRGIVTPASARSNSSELPPSRETRFGETSRRGRPDTAVPAYPALPAHPAPAPADLSTLGGDWCGDCFVVD